MINNRLVNIFYRMKWSLLLALFVAVCAAMTEVSAVYILGKLLANATQNISINLEIPFFQADIEATVVFIIVLRIVLGVGVIRIKTNLVNKVRENILLDFNLSALKSKKELRTFVSKSEFVAAFFGELNVFCYGFLNHLVQILNDVVMLILFAVLFANILGIANLIWLLAVMVVIGTGLVGFLKSGHRYGLRRQAADQSLANYISSSHDASANIIIENREHLYKRYMESSLISVSKANLAAQVLIGMPKIFVDSALLIFVAMFTLIPNHNAEFYFELEDASILLLLIVRGLPISGRLVTTLQNLNYTRVSIVTVSQQYDNVQSLLESENVNCVAKFITRPVRQLECEFTSETGEVIRHQFAANDGVIAIKGASGVGKTSFLKAIGGVPNNKYSQFIIEGDIIPKFAMISQNGLEFNYKSNDFLNPGDAKTIEFSNFLNVDLSKFNILKSVEEIKSNYSGGEFERIQLVRSLASDIDILLMDETGSGLDEKHKFAMLKALSMRSDLIRILVSHDDTLLKHANRIIEFK